MVGQSIGKYRILELLGRGGMGTVYKALDESLQRVVAVKFVNSELSESEMARFRTEAIALARLNHPQIATIYELTEHDQAMVMVMEYVAGQTLDQVLAARGPLPLSRAIEIATDVLDGLGYAHESGIVHRDLKPANVMLTQAGDVKIMDFGIALIAGMEHVTSTGMTVGTPAYMSPEQVQGHEVDGRSDLYSVAVMLYRLVTGQLPFKADTAVAMIRSQLSDPPTPARTHRADLPEWFDQALARALAKLPRDRFQTAGELSGALRWGLAGTTAHQAIQRPASANRGRTYAAAGAVLAVAAVAAAAFVFRGAVHPREESPSASSAVQQASPDSAPPASTPTSASAAVPTVVAQPAVSNPVGVGNAPGSTPTATPTSAPPRALTPAPSPARPPTTVARATPQPTRTKSAAEASDVTPAEPPAAMRTPAPAPSAQDALVFKDVKLETADGGKSKEVDAILSFDGGRIEVRSEKGGVLLKTLPYHAIISATYSQSKHPRWKEGLGAAVVVGVFSAPIFFMKSTRHWLTLQAKDDFMVLQLDKGNVNVVLPAVEARTGRKVEHLVGDR